VTVKWPASSGVELQTTLLSEEDTGST